jgi:hypothetical protein
VYFAVEFSGFVETMNIFAGNKRQRKQGMLKLQQE